MVGGISPAADRHLRRVLRTVFPRRLFALDPSRASAPNVSLPQHAPRYARLGIAVVELAFAPKTGLVLRPERRQSIVERFRARESVGLLGISPAAACVLGRLVTWARSSDDRALDLRLLAQHPQALGLAIVSLGFFGQWLPWALSPRITFLYHMLPSVPFGCLLIAWSLERLPWKRLRLAYLGAVFVSFVFFYPIYSALPISPAFTAVHYWMPGWVP